MEEPFPLQEIIGVDKKNPFLTVCADPQQPGKLMVFFGLYPNLSKVNVAHGAILALSDAIPRVYGIS